MAKFCEECGEPVTPGARFCEACGAPVAAPAATPQPPRQATGPVSAGAKRNRSILIAAFVAVAVVGAGVGAFVRQRSGIGNAPRETARAGANAPLLAPPRASSPALASPDAGAVGENAARDSSVPSGFEDRARQFAAAYFASWSGDDSSALAWLSQNYASEVSYYGVPKARARILAEKAAFVRRWPERSYDIEPDLRVDCQSAVCRIVGLVHYRCRSAARNASASGRAEFTLLLDFSGASPVISAESGRVISRED